MEKIGNKLPKGILFELKKYLNDNEQYFRKELQITALMIEKGDYQISIKSENELNDIIKELNENLTLT